MLVEPELDKNRSKSLALILNANGNNKSITRNKRIFLKLIEDPSVDIGTSAIVAFSGNSVIYKIPEWLIPCVDLFTFSSNSVYFCVIISRWCAK